MKNPAQDGIDVVNKENEKRQDFLNLIEAIKSNGLEHLDDGGELTSEEIVLAVIEDLSSSSPFFNKGGK